MSKTLLLFIQSPNLDVYVNALTHCVKEEEAREVYFIGNKDVSGKGFELQEIINGIRQRLHNLAQEHQEYNDVLECLPKPAQLEARVIRTSFVRPQDVIPIIKRLSQNLDDCLVDITGCSKQLAGDVMSSFMANGIVHICHFELAVKAVSPEWKTMGKTMLYHDLTGVVTYYEYKDFSNPGTTLESFRRLRVQGKIVKGLFLISVILGLAVIILIKQQQSNMAQISALALAVITGLGLMSDSFSLFDRFK